MLTLSPGQPEGESLSINDDEGNAVGFFGDQTTTNAEIFEKGMAKIDEGIALYPNRLDMRYGKIFAIGQVKDWERFTNEIVLTVQYSGKINNEWTWTFDEKKEDGKELFLSGLQNY